MNELVINHASDLEIKLYELYRYGGFRFHSWLAFVKSLDPNITSVYRAEWDTYIVFKNEECKTWFLLNWA